MKWTEKYFYDTLLYEKIIQNKVIDFGNQEIEIVGFTNDTIELINCHIIAGKIRFKDIDNQDLSIRFINCNIEAKLKFENCKFENLEFRNISNLKSLRLDKGYNFNDDDITMLNRFYFLYDKEISSSLHTDFYFKECSFGREFLFRDIKQESGTFIFELNTIGNSDLEGNNIRHYFNITNSILNNVCFHKNNFLSTFLINECTFNYKDITTLKYTSTTFSLNKFSKIAFQNSNFNDKTLFGRCQFMDMAYFENIENIENSELKFSDCQFDQYTTFTRAKISNFSIEKSVFQNIVSFQDTRFKTIKIDKPHFDKLAYFDGIQIDEIDKCDRRTVRTIKQQLQKADNKIDYNRFRAYELAAYYRELEWTWKDGKDKFILGATWLVTGFDHSWRRAVGFTICSGFAWYSVLYFSKFHGSFDFSKINNYFTGAFRFFLVTDFSSPFKDKGDYLDNALLWVPLILGKIFIAFGIYEMIQAFRKFKA